MFLDALGDTTLIILMCCAVLSIVINLIFAQPSEKPIGSRG
jgi:hypothetical protein